MNDEKACHRVHVLPVLLALQTLLSWLTTCVAGCQRVVLDISLSSVQSRLLTCAADVVDISVSLVSSEQS